MRNSRKVEHSLGRRLVQASIDFSWRFVFYAYLITSYTDSGIIANSFLSSRVPNQTTKMFVWLSFHFRSYQSLSIRPVLPRIDSLPPLTILQFSWLPSSPWVVMLTILLFRQICPSFVPPKCLPIWNRLPFNLEWGRSMAPCDYNQGDSYRGPRLARWPQSRIPSAGWGLQSLQERSCRLRKESAPDCPRESSTLNWQECSDQELFSCCLNNDSRFASF